MRKFLDIVTNTVETTSVEPTAVTEQARPNMLERYVGLIEEGYTDATIGGLKVEEFVRGYIEAMLFSSTDYTDDEPLNKNFTAEDIAHESMDRIHSDCRSFLHAAASFITPERFKGAKLSSLEAQAGHDFWLTRCGHGAGYWDGDWEGEDRDGVLTKKSEAFGCVDPYVGDDGKIHLM